MVHITTSWRGVAVLVAAALAILGVIAWSLSRPDENTPDLGTRTVQAGDVEVTMTALALNGSGAVFKIVLDTHTVELDLDLAASAQLTVNGAVADGAVWEGQGPGGHHREGTLRFATPVPAGATADLRVIGLPQDVTGTWSAP
ncbi:hypothetical protein SK571_43105 [Lentzea sp. BCCO 10_0798]|uniref:DUF4352 domain-containing protein n=1 Tax=Lentzea kristufekii TaxID=3095430 RepID=A0ABU4U781_9PSEU|nr:hypothetical protein [Lentzea sp. BCCO 10_0798]MDX8056205.1 hypothetical protein [Lentzea sp. BCCO 10_0798]